MANPNRRLPNNAKGEFYVDSTCINCDTCRQLAPNVFEEDNGYSIVIKQPQDEEDERKSMQAVISCPTGSIGHGENQNRKIAREDFPLQLDTGLYYCGFASKNSYGGSSYLVEHNEMTWLVDAPRYTPYLVEKFEELGGIDYIFLTHRDDVAAADQYAEIFGAPRIIHQNDKSAQPDAEHIIEGVNSVDFQEGYKIIPTPGHTSGHMVLLVNNRYLFTGDHLYWKRDWDGLRATRRMCWYDWPTQVESMKQLRDYSFEWVLPGHGQRKKLPKKQMKKELNILIKKMEDPDYW